MEQERGVVNLILNIITTVLLIIVMLIVVALVVICLKTNKATMEIPDFMGYKPTICISNSMEDEFEVGDIIISKIALKDNIKVGDIITYREGETIVTHRVENIVYENNQIKYVTKGDSNNTIDENKIAYSQIEGVYCYKIPKIGNIVLMIQKPQGFLIVFFIPVAIIACIYKLIINRKEIKELRKTKLLKRLQEKQISIIK